MKGRIEPHADVIFLGGAVFTTGWERSRSQDVAVRAGAIVAVAEPGCLDDLRGPATEAIDLTGRMLLPGFQDAHVHPVQAGVELLQCDLTRATDAEDCLRIVAAFATAHPDEPWIVDAGWSMEFFPGGTPTREALDAVLPDRPVALSNRDHHGMWVNTRALVLAGITASTPDPTALDAVGFAVHFHALGDRAVTEALDAVEAARAANGSTASRHQLAHLQLVAHDDIPRFAALDAVANLQPLWACHEPQLDELTLPFLEPALRHHRCHRTRIPCRPGRAGSRPIRRAARGARRHPCDQHVDRRSRGLPPRVRVSPSGFR